MFLTGGVSHHAGGDTEIDHDADADHVAILDEGASEERAQCQACQEETPGCLCDRANLRFADPTGRSALRAASASNPRALPCPNCRQPNRLTPTDQALGYQCDACADRTERGGDYQPASCGRLPPGPPGG